MKTKASAFLLLSCLALSSCAAIHPSMTRWNRETQSYENSKWYDDQLSKFTVAPTEDGRMTITPSEEEAVKAGVNRRIYRTFKHQVDLLNAQQEGGAQK